MAITFTTRFGFPQWSADTDAFVTRAQLDSVLATLDSQAAQYAQNVASARPGFGVAGRLYEATDTGVLSYDTGAAWVTIGVLIDTVVADITTSHPGDAGAAGGIGKGADAGHRHPREAWGLVGDITASAPGDAAAVGASGREADAAHKHGREAWGVVGDITTSHPGDAGAAGATGRNGDAGHRHPREAWGLVGDLQAPGTAAAGATGRVPDAGHVHPAPAPVLTSAAGSLGSDVTITSTTIVTILTTASLAVGTWRVRFGLLLLIGQGLVSNEVWMDVGTATATFAGQQATEELLQVGARGTLSVDCIVTVTVAGTLTLKAYTAGTASTAKAATSGTQARANVTGYTAVKIA